MATCPQGLIDASESFVGLPKGQMGNSEVGHMNLGAGRVAVPDLPRIDNAIEDGTLARSPILAETIARLKQSGAGTAPDGPRLTGRRACPSGPSGLPRQPGRGPGRAGVDPCLPPTVGTCRRAVRWECLDHIQAGLKPGLPIRFATVIGRFYAMDRDKRWERVTVAYDAMVDAKGERASTARDAVDRAYAAKLDDEFVLPTAIDGYTGMKDGDGLLMFNYRSDRAREILTALLDPRFDGFNRNRVVAFAETVGMVEYSAAL